MTVLLILLIVLPWSIWRQMHAHAVTAQALRKLPIIFGAVGAIWIASDVPVHTGSALGYYAACAVLAIGFGLWRGQRVSIWWEGATPMQRGNRVTLMTWGVMIALKIALGTIADVTGWIPAEGGGEIFAFLAVTFAAQNLVVARRTLWTPAGVTA